MPSPPSFLVKEEEKQKLLQRGSELQSEHQQLEERDRRLASAVKVCGAGGSALGTTGCRRSKRYSLVTEAPEEDGLSSVIQGVSRWRGQLCDSVDTSLSSSWASGSAPSQLCDLGKAPSLNLHFFLYKGDMVVSSL